MDEHKLSIFDYLEKLQFEYFSNLFRSKICTEPVFVQLYGDIAEKKKKNVLSVSHKANRPSIFSSREHYDKFLEEKFLQPFGLPALVYNPLKKSSYYYDCKGAFKPGTRVRYRGSDYIVKENNPDNQTIIIMVNDSPTVLRSIDVELLVRDLFR